MADTTSYIEMLRKFGVDLGLPKPNVDQLVETQKKNIEALGQSAQRSLRARNRSRRSSAS